MRKRKKVIKIPVFDSGTNDWLGTVYYARSYASKENLEDVCAFCVELDKEECEEVSDSIGYPVRAGWYDVYGSNCIFVMIGEE